MSVTTSRPAGGASRGKCLTNPGVTQLPHGVQEVSFASGDSYCAAWHYAGGTTGACIVMAPGVGALKELGLPRFAEQFAKAGHDVLIFDFRRFGQSGGQPRQVPNIADFREDFTAAIALARTLPGVQRDRIILWGMSFGGGLVVDLAAHLDGIAAAIAQGPMTDGRAASGTVPRSLQLRVLAHAIRDRLGAAISGRPHHIPLAAPAGQVAMRSSAEALGAPAALNPNSYPWLQYSAARFMLEIALYRPGNTAGSIRCPLLVVAPDQDEVISVPAAVRAAQLAPRGEILSVPGDHYAPFRESFELAAAGQLQFIDKHLRARTTPT